MKPFFPLIFLFNEKTEKSFRLIFGNYNPIFILSEILERKGKPLIQKGINLPEDFSQGQYSKISSFNIFISKIYSPFNLGRSLFLSGFWLMLTFLLIPLF